MLIVGPCGTGKSQLAQALVHIAVRHGYDTVFTSHANLLSQLPLARTVGAYERKLTVLTKADLLIIDDFGLKPMRPGHDEDFHDVIADRSERTTDDQHQQSGLLGMERRLPQQVAGRGHPRQDHARRLPGRVGRQELQDSYSRRTFMLSLVEHTRTAGPCI